MIAEKGAKKEYWLKRSTSLLRSACTPWGIKASLGNLDNYGAIFTRDAVMVGIAGLLLKDETIIEGFKNTLIYLKKLQGKQGQIASNYTMKDGEVSKVSFGTLSPKIDACTWYLIGVGLLLKEGRIEQTDFEESVEKTIGLLEAWEYNGKHLVYIPKGGNWADEYVYEGYIFYDQILRAWGLALLAPMYQNKTWADKSDAILACLDKKYRDESSSYYHSSFYPGGVFKHFDLAAHALAGIIFPKENLFLNGALDWIVETFMDKNNCPPAFFPAITETDSEWATLRNYHLFEFKNKPHHYHNGGIWWIWLGWLAIGLSIQKKEKSVEKLLEISFEYLDNAEHFDFEEYVSADSLELHGTKKLCYTATGIIFLCLCDNSSDFSTIKPPTYHDK